MRQLLRKLLLGIAAHLQLMFAAFGVRKQGDNIVAGVRVQFVLVLVGLGVLTIPPGIFKMGAQNLFFVAHRHIAIITSRQGSAAVTVCIQGRGKFVHSRKAVDVLA